MASVTFPTNLGGSGQTISDDADPNTGLANGGHRLRFVPALQGAVDMAQYVYKYAAKIDQAADDADRAENARGYVEAYAGALKSNIETHYDKLATLKLDFGRGRYFADDGDLTETTNPLDLLTVTRATPKWVVGPNGKLREVPIDTVARRWRNGLPQGVLIEESRTNLLLWNEAFDDAVWSKNLSSITADATSAPDGNTTADKLVENTGAGVHSAFQDISSSTDGQDYVGSVFVKAAERTRCRVTIAGLAVSNVDASLDLMLTESTPNSEYMGDGWHRIFATSVASGGGSVRLIVAIVDDSGVVGYTGDGTSGIYIWGAQLEEGTTPSSPIPTTDSPVTRAADNVSMVLGGEFNPSEGTLYAEFYPALKNTDNQLIFGVSDGTSSNRTLMRHNYANQKRSQFISVRDGVVSSRIASGVLIEGLNKVALSYNQSGWTQAVNGYTSTLSDVTGDVIATTAHLSNAPGAQQDNSTRKVVSYYPRALTEAELQELTS